MNERETVDSLLPMPSKKNAAKRTPSKTASAKERSSAAKQTQRGRVATSEDHGQPKFTYTTEPQALGRLLKEIPNRPRPQRVTFETLKSWSVSARNTARTAINVLREMGLLGSGGEPTEMYTDFMKTGGASPVL